MNKTIFFIVIVAIVVALSGCGAPDAPAEIGDSDKDILAKAFAKADKGEDPAMTCVVLAGKVAGYAERDRDISQKALAELQTCYTDVRLRYYEALLKQEDKDAACQTIFTATRVWRMSLGSEGDAHGMDSKALDQRVADTIEPRIKGVCPDYVIEALRGE